jgi:2',3'-cyclic-nucleotide 2'-phosphodiesterase (5'-nucleotidase family)
MAILVDGDVFEQGNALSRRTEGALDFALFARLRQRAPVILTLGNHDADLFPMAEVVARLRRLGVVVISGNVRDHGTGKPLANAVEHLKLGASELTIVGLTTDSLGTFRAAVRPSLDIEDPVTWGMRHLAALLGGASVPIVLSHAGLRADRALLDAVPDGTLFIGAHDHLRLVDHRRATVYLQSGSWLGTVSVAVLQRTGEGPRWDVRPIPLPPAGPADAEFATVVRDTIDKNLTAEERAIVGTCARAMDPDEAARFAVDAARKAAGADVGLIGATTFGGGLPAGAVTRHAFDDCVRFDGTLYVGEVDGAQLQKILARASPGPSTPLSERTGENLVTVAPADIEPQRRYRFVTTDWIARSAARFLGDDAPALVEKPALHLKPAVLAQLQR